MIPTYNEMVPFFKMVKYLQRYNWLPFADRISFQASGSGRWLVKMGQRKGPHRSPVRLPVRSPVRSPVRLPVRLPHFPSSQHQPGLLFCPKICTFAADIFTGKERSCITDCGLRNSSICNLKSDDIPYLKLKPRNLKLLVNGIWFIHDKKRVCRNYR